MLRFARLTFTLAVLATASVACGPKDRNLPTYTDEQLLTDPVANFRLGVHILEHPDKNGYVDYQEAYRKFRNSADLGGGAKAHFNAAWVAEVLNRPEDAERHYGAAYEADAGYAAALYSYARVLTDNGKGPQAAELFRAYVASNPNDLEVRNDFVATLAAAGMYDEAEAQAREILMRDADNAAVYRNLSAMYFAQGKYGMAQLCNEKALSLEEGDGGTYNNIAMTYLLQGDDESAIAELQTALQVDPNNFEANTNLGYIALDSGDYGLALDKLSRAVDARPSSAVAKMGLAVAYRGSRDYDRADALYRELIAADPDNSLVYFNAAILHEKYTRDFDKSLDYLQKFVENNQVGPSHEVFGRMERVKATKAEEERRIEEEAAKRREEEERQRRNQELLSSMAGEIDAFEAKVTTNADCLGETAMEAQMFIETARESVIVPQDVQMAPDIKQMLDDYYAPMVDEAMVACGGAAPEDGAEEGELEQDGTEEGGE